ncbi:sorting nexin-20 [Macrobrachium rosenbergii]|uniref:sorting nexin-20 n=1 Tax=Macrobrachium rosenbergii TaxID=79674 RepID=UPI0034D798BA
MDTDDDISTLEEEEVSLLHPQSPGSGRSVSPSFTLDSDSSLDEIASISNQDDIVAPEVLVQSLSELVVKPRVKTIVFFEISSAQSKSIQGEKYVAYLVEVKHKIEISDDEEAPKYTDSIERNDASHSSKAGGHMEKIGSFERRYSEFLTVYNALMKSHRSLMEEFVGFPKKVLIGNFSVEVITERCKGLERFMNFVYAEDVLRRTAVFSNLLYGQEIKKTDNLLLHSEFEEACPLLERTYILLQGLHWDTGLVLRILCQWIVSLHYVSEYERSCQLAEIAMAKFMAPGNKKVKKELFLPFLNFCNALWRTLGKDRSLIRAEIERMQSLRKKEDGVPNLLDLLRDEIALRTLH